MHYFKYSLKILFKNKMLIFWTFAFPIILGTLFNFAFSKIEESDKLGIIDIAVVKTENYNNNEYYKEAFKSLSEENSDTQMFNTKYTTLEEAKELLNKKEITGYIIFDEENKVYVNENGYLETIIKYVVEEITQKEKIFNNIIEQKTIEEYTSSQYKEINDITQKIYQEAMILMEDNEANIKDITTQKLSYTVIEYYTLIAMACLYGAMLGETLLNQSLANMSNTGKRIAISPTKKSKIIISNIFASYIAQLVGLALLFIYLILILKVDFGTNLPLIILLSLVGAVAGLSLGIFVSSCFKTNENNKTGIIISIAMLGVFLSGMMGVSMKYIIDKNIPIINKINPAAMITDGFYSLYYYQTLDRYWFNIISLLVFSFILITISIIKLRGQKYDNI